MACWHILQWEVSVFDFVELAVGFHVEFNEGFDERVDESVEESPDADPWYECVDWLHGERVEGKTPDE
jgi:hypothetical protein